MHNTVLAIDRGTTQIKAALFDFSGNVLKIVSVPCEQATGKQPGWFEQDLPLIWEHVSMAVRRLWQEGFDPQSVAAVSVTGQGCGVFLLDEHGQPVRRGIVSLDERARGMAKQADRDGTSGRARAITGFGLIGCSPQLILKWVKENEPENYARIRYTLFSKDWVNYCLTGVLCTDRTDASGAGLLRLGSHQPADEVFGMLDMPEAAQFLPPVYESGRVIGTVTETAAEKTGLLAGTPVVAGAHDIAGCAYGTCGDREGDLVLIFGTLGVVLAPMASAYAPGKGATTLKGASSQGWLTHANIRGAGRSLDWFVDLLMHAEKEQAAREGASVFTRIEEKLDACRLSDVICHPYLFGEKVNADAAGGLNGLKGWHTRWDVLMGAYQGVVYAFLNAVREIEKIRATERIFLCGGGSNSRLICQLLADSSGVEVIVPVTGETTCRGGALLAIAQANPAAGVLQAPAVAPGRVYRPNPQMRTEHEARFARFLAMQDTLSRGVWGF